MSDEGSFLTCWNEVMQALVSGDSKLLETATTRLAVHFVRLERQVRDMQDDRTDPSNGKMYDIHRNFETLESVVEKVRALQEGQETTNKQLITTFERIRGGIWVFGTTGTIILTLLTTILSLCIYVWAEQQTETRRQIERLAATSLEQTVVLERVQTIQQHVVNQLERMRDK